MHSNFVLQFSSTILRAVSSLAFRENSTDLSKRVVLTQSRQDSCSFDKTQTFDKARRSSLYHLTAGFIASYDSLSRWRGGIVFYSVPPRTGRKMVFPIMVLRKVGVQIFLLSVQVQAVSLYTQAQMCVIPSNRRRQSKTEAKMFKTDLVLLGMTWILCLMVFERDGSGGKSV